MSNNPKRITERLKECDVVLVGDRWKENYKEDVSVLIQHAIELEKRFAIMANSANIQSQVMGFLASALQEIAEIPEPIEDPFSLIREVRANCKSILEELKAMAAAEPELEEIKPEDQPSGLILPNG